MNVDDKLGVLARIARRLNAEGICWAIGASLLLYLKGIADGFVDIDIMVSERDAERLCAVLGEMGEQMPPNPHARYHTRVFREFAVEGVDIDVMAGFVIVASDGISHECPFDEHHIEERLEVRGQDIPLMSVAEWRGFYELMGRTVKVAMIDAVLKRPIWMRTERLGFGAWTDGDGALARKLWGNPQVTRLICASGSFTPEEVEARLAMEVANGEAYGVQYWPFFTLADGSLVGCCGLRPAGERDVYELGFHLLPQAWGKGYATEAARAVIAYAFATLGARRIEAGHNPANDASAHVLAKLGFVRTGEEFYPPTGLMHPSYELVMAITAPTQESVATEC